MRLTPKYIDIILNILLGAAWAAVLYSFLWGFNSIDSNFFLKLISAFIHSVIALVLVLLVELLFRFFENNQLLKEQTKILKELKDID